MPYSSPETIPGFFWSLFNSALFPDTVVPRENVWRSVTLKGEDYSHWLSSKQSRSSGHRNSFTFLLLLDFASVTTRALLASFHPQVKPFLGRVLG